MSVTPRIDILCDGNDKIGFGHIRRSQTLAAQLVRDGMLVRVMGNSAQSSVMLPVKTAEDSVPTITIFDTPLDIDEKLSSLAKQGGLTIALDYFGNALPDVNIAVFAHQVVRAKRVTYVGFEYILIRDEISGLRGNVCSERSGRVMVMLGGADILGQGHLAAQALVQAGFRVTLIQGPYAVSYPRCSNYEVCTNPSNLPELFARCDWAVTSGGGSLFEGLCLGKAVHVLPQTAAEERIARHFDSRGGLLGIGLDSLRAYSVNEVINIAAKGAHLVDGLGAQRVSQIVRSWL
jgi:spore coat polysaccharide biosynthesis predicted glycosyltransferase SpsG